MGSLRDLHKKETITFEVPSEIVLYQIECTNAHRGPKLISATYRPKLKKYSIEWHFYPIKDWQPGMWVRAYTGDFLPTTIYVHETPEGAWKHFIASKEAERNLARDRMEAYEKIIKKAKKKSGLG